MFIDEQIEMIQTLDNHKWLRMCFLLEVKAKRAIEPIKKVISSEEIEHSDSITRLIAELEGE